jgi:hypothetical protein
MALMWRGEKVAKMTQRQRNAALDEIVARLDILHRQQRRSAAWHQEEAFLQLMAEGIRCAGVVEHIWRSRLDPEYANPQQQTAPPPKARRARR